MAMATLKKQMPDFDKDMAAFVEQATEQMLAVVSAQTAELEKREIAVEQALARTRRRAREEAHGHVETKKAHEVAKIRYVTDQVSPPVPEPLPEMKPIPHVRKKEGPAFGNNLMQQVTEQLRPGSPAAAPQLQERRCAPARRKREEGATAEIREFSDRLRRQRSSIREEYQHHVDERVEAFVKNEMHENGAEAKRIANEIKQQIAKAQHDKLFDEMNSVSSKNAFSIKKKQRRAEAADEEEDDDDDPDSDFKRNFDREMSLRLTGAATIGRGPHGRDIEGIVSLVDEALVAKMVHREVHQESAAQQVIKYISGDISDNMSTQIRNLVASELAPMAQQIGTSIARQLGADAQTTANVGKIISSHVKDNGRKGKGGVGVVIVDQLRTIIDTQRRATELMLQQRPQERVLVAGRSPTASPEPPREPAPHEFAPIRDDDGAAASPGKHAKKPKSPKKHHHSKKPRADDPAAPEAADDEAAASSDSDDEAAPPAVQEDEEFEETLTAVLAAVGDEEEPTLAVSSKALGGLEVEHESLVSLKEELLTLQRAHERAQAQTPDAAVDDDVREEVLVKLEVVNERLATVEEVRDEITGSIAGWGIDALVVARHENDKLARKAKAMAGWLAAVGNDGGNDAYKTYEGTSRAMAREIDARRLALALTLSDGSLNEDIDPTVWPPADAFKIMEQLMLYYKEEVNAQANAKFDAEDELLELRKKPRKSMFEAAASSNAVMHEGKMIDADQVGADDFDVDAFLKRPEGMADGRMTLDHLNKWQDERVAAASLRVEVAKVLSLVLGSPMALLVQRPMPDVDLDPINKFKDDMKRTAFGKKQLGNKASSSTRTPSPRRAPVLLEDPVDVGPGPVEPPPDPKPGEAPPANTYADEIAVHYGPRNMEKAQSLLETVRRGMRGMKGYDGSEKDNERVHRTVVGALNKDKGDVTTLREILDRVVRREKEQRSQIDLLEREVRVIVRSQVENQRRVDALEAAYESESASDVVANLRAEIRSCHEDAERSEATIASLQETLAETNADDGQLERLEYMMAKYRDVAEIHGALLPQYAAVDEELEAVRTMSRLRKFKAGERDPLEAKAGQLQDRKDELEHRLLVIFREVQEVEKLMRPLESAFGRGAACCRRRRASRARDAPPTQKTQPGRVESYRSLANLAAKVTTKPRRDPEEDAAQVLNEATLKLKYNVMAGLEDRHKLRPLRNLPSTSIKRFQSRTG
ncbi:hypothetical protein JL721_6623 [Aureococcus anophagefferens]|nr:hypothetical protein JL721_6623 [Aureococcus anophagefferens]